LLDLFLGESLDSKPGKKVLAFTSVNDEINGNKNVGAFDKP